jgi:hypothetical protein
MVGQQKRRGMGSRSVDSVTNDEELVRLNIYDGDLPVTDGSRELLAAQKMYIETMLRQFQALEKKVQRLQSITAQTNVELRRLRFEVRQYREAEAINPDTVAAESPPAPLLE